MLLASRIATTAVTPRCPHCGLPVRSSVQLQADAADLGARLLATQTRLTRERTSEAWRAYQALAAHVAHQLEALDAELAGEHLVCPVH